MREELAKELAGNDELGRWHQYERTDEDGHGVCACGWTSRSIPGQAWPDPRFAVKSHVAWVCDLDPDMDVRKVWPRAAVELGDRLRAEGLIRDGDRTAINAAVLPPELRTALGGVEAAAPDTSWPHWATVLDPVDWPALIAAHPDVVTVTADELAANGGASWEAITRACALIEAAGLAPAVQGLLEVDTAARITLFPVAVVAHGGPVPADVAEKVAAVLVEGERNRDELGAVAGEWIVSC
jgi:hypothetical protein